jgi:hypothetical protein
MNMLIPKNAKIKIIINHVCQVMLSKKPVEVVTDSPNAGAAFVAATLVAATLVALLDIKLSGINLDKELDKLFVFALSISVVIIIKKYNKILL